MSDRPPRPLTWYIKRFLLHLALYVPVVALSAWLLEIKMDRPMAVFIVVCLVTHGLATELIWSERKPWENADV